MYEIYAKLRDSRNLSDYRVAKDLKISRAMLSSWGTGKYKPKIDKLMKIADYFNVSINYLMGIEESGEAPKEERAMAMYRELDPNRQERINSYIEFLHAEMRTEKKNVSAS